MSAMIIRAQRAARRAILLDVAFTDVIAARLARHMLLPCCCRFTRHMRLMLTPFERCVAAVAVLMLSIYAAYFAFITPFADFCWRLRDLMMLATRLLRALLPPFYDIAAAA